MNIRTSGVVLALIPATSSSPVAAVDLTRVAECTSPQGFYCIWVEPQISPDGRSYAFTNGTRPPWNGWWPHIALAAFDGSPPAHVGVPDGWDEAPAWAPDGSYLAITVSGEGTSVGLWTVAVSDPTRPDSYRQLFTAAVREPSWSLDGAKIAYVEGGDIWSVDLDGSVPTYLCVGSSPSWGPDGRLVFTRGNDLWIFAPGGGVSQLTQTGWGERDPAWSPSGEWIAYVSDLAGTDVWLTTPSGNASVRLTTMGGTVKTPSWTGDGKTLMFHFNGGKDEFWLATDLPDAPVSVTSRPWGDVKQTYR